MYYYFKSKEEVFDALVERTYQGIIDECHEIAFGQGENAIEKLKRLYKHYRNALLLDANASSEETNCLCSTNRKGTRSKRGKHGLFCELKCPEFYDIFQGFAECAFK